MAESNNPILQYREQAISTMSKGELLVKLFDEELKNLKYASMLFQNGNCEAGKKCTTKCKDILNYLCAILDDKYSLSADLRKVYSYFICEIIRADTSRDAAPLDKITPMIQDLRETWAQAEKLSRMQNNKGKGKSQSV
jgi:flagellar protein FliS